MSQSLSQTAPVFPREQAPPWVRELRNFLKRFRSDSAAVLGALLMLAVIICAIAAPVLAPHDPEQADLRARLKPPAWQVDGNSDYLLGADPIGRDLLSRIIYGARISLFVGIVGTAISLLVGASLGLLAAFYGGFLDSLLMRIADAQLAFPFILLAITVMAIFGTGLVKLVLVLGITGWVGYARVIRGETLSTKEREFVHAARTIGATDRRIILRHILPNVFSSMIVLATVNIAINILLEAGLTFLGLGVDPTIPSWGGMLADGRGYIVTAWWVSTFPGLAIMLTVLGFNLLGDWLRDELDPQTRLNTL
jgi:peptide/nickel transport system permease protein